MARWMHELRAGRRLTRSEQDEKRERRGRVDLFFPSCDPVFWSTDWSIGPGLMAWCGHGPSSVRLCAWLVVVRRHWLQAWAHLQLQAVPVLGCWTGVIQFFYWGPTW